MQNGATCSSASPRRSEPRWRRCSPRSTAACSTRDECLLLAHCTGDDLFGLVVAANEMRRQLVGDVVTYVVTRNINFTNVCFVGLQVLRLRRGSARRRRPTFCRWTKSRRSRAKPSMGRDRGLHSGRPAARPAAVLLPRHSARGEVGHAEDALPTPSRPWRCSTA